MTIIGSNIEEACKFLLLKNISFEIKNKTYKKGLLTLFYQKNFYLSFILKSTKKDKDKFEIPIPFGVEVHEEDNLVYFDYRLKTLAKHCPDIIPHLKMYHKKVANNKFWDTILTIDADYGKERTTDL
jgi:hypothetical protein